MALDGTVRLHHTSLMQTNVSVLAMALLAFGVGLFGMGPVPGPAPAAAGMVVKIGRGAETGALPDRRPGAARKDRDLQRRAVSRSLPGGEMRPDPDRPRNRPDQWKDRRGKPHPRWPWPRGHPWSHGYPFVYSDDDDDDEGDVLVVPIPVPQPREELAAPPEPPDPRGSFTRIPARGVASSRQPFEPGATIGAGVPVVVLDWRTHALPEPPPGQMWVRVAGQVLRIDSASREILALAPDAAPASAPADPTRALDREPAPRPG